MAQGGGGYDAAVDEFIRSSVALQPPLETKNHKTRAEERGRAKLVRENEELKQTLLDAMVEPVCHRCCSCLSKRALEDVGSDLFLQENKYNYQRQEMS